MGIAIRTVFRGDFWTLTFLKKVCAYVYVNACVCTYSNSEALRSEQGWYALIKCLHVLFMSKISEYFGLPSK